MVIKRPTYDFVYFSSSKTLPTLPCQMTSYFWGYFGTPLPTLGLGRHLWTFPKQVSVALKSFPRDIYFYLGHRFSINCGQSHYREVPRWGAAGKILATFWRGRYNVFWVFLPMKTWNTTASKVAHNRPNFFFSNANWPKSSPNLNSCSIKISHRGTSL